MILLQILLVVTIIAFFLMANNIIRVLLEKSEGLFNFNAIC